jgi:hypothetical protein
MKNKKGEWWLIFGLISILLAVGVAGVVSIHMPRIAKLRAEGLVAQATLLAKAQQTRHYRSSKGRDKTTTDYVLNVSYDSLATQRFADLAPGNVPATSASPVTITHEMISSKADYERYQVGDKFDVVYLPYRSFAPEFGEFVRDYQPFYQILFALVAGVCGCWMTLKGWRLRKLGGLSPITQGAHNS